MRTPKQHLISFAFAAAAFLFAGPASAAVVYEFGVPLNVSSPAAPAGTFATLSVDTTTWTFALHALDGLDAFGSTAFLGALAVDGEIAGGITISDVVSDSGVTVAYHPGSGPGGAFDFRNAFPNKKSARLMAGESVQWKISGLSSLNALGLHVQSIGADGESSGWYGPGEPPAAVPLPATAWLLGTSLIGLVSLARRRRDGKGDTGSVSER